MIILISNLIFLIPVQLRVLATSFEPVESKFEPWLWEKLQQLEANETARSMTIVFSVNCSAYKGNITGSYNFKEQIAALLANEHNATILWIGRVLSFINVQIMTTEIKKIATYEFVDGIGDGEEEGSIGLYNSTSAIRSDIVAQRLGYNGSGVNASILDTGINPNHPDFAGKTIIWRDFVNFQANPYDDNGHGTHCAGIFAGNGQASNGVNKGVAPGITTLIIGKMGDQQATFTEANAIAALDWAVSQRAHVISCSWGTRLRDCNGQCQLCRKADECVRNGVIIVPIAHNDGPNSRTISCPGTAFDVITVGAIDDCNTKNIRDDTLCPFSGRGPTRDGRPKPDVVAPGLNIMSPNATGGYSNFGGTSAAAPHVAGVAALILQAHPKWTPAMVKCAINATANLNDLLIQPDPAHNPKNDRGCGIVDAARAISLPATEIPPDQADSKYENCWGNAGVTAYLNGTFKIWASGTIFGDAYAEARLNKTFTPSRTLACPTFFFGFHDDGKMESDLGYAEFHVTLKLWQGDTILASTEKEIHHVDWGGAYDADCYHTIQLTYQGKLNAGQQYKLEYGFWTFAHMAWSNFYNYRPSSGITALHLTAIGVIGPGNPSFEERGVSVYDSWYWVNNNAGWRNVRGDLDDDGDCDYHDEFLFRKAYLGPYDWEADFNGDGIVNYQDLFIFRNSYLYDIPCYADGIYSWYTSGGGDYTISQWLCDHDVNIIKGHEIWFIFYFRPETVEPDGSKNYARAEIFYITDTGSNRTENGPWVYPKELNWYAPLILITLPANTIAIRVTIHGGPDFRAWIDKTSININIKH